jgi:hypothetical protein
MDSRGLAFCEGNCHWMGVVPLASRLGSRSFLEFRLSIFCTLTLVSRAFSGGVAVGSEAFVEEVFNERRELFGPKRERGARRVVGGKGPLKAVLCALRELSGR